MTSGKTAGGQLIALESHLLDWVQAAVLVTDLDGVVIYANQQCEVLYGRNPKQLMGVDAKFFGSDSTKPGPMTPGLFPEIARHVLKGQNWEGDFRIERADGAAVDVHAVDSPLFDATGKVVGLVCLAYDVNAPQLSQAELRRIIAVAQILRDIGETLVAELDADRVLQTTIGAARKLTGASMATFLSLDAEDTESSFVVRARSGRGRGDSKGASLPIDEPLLAGAIDGKKPIRFDDLEPERAAALDVVLPSQTPPLRSCIVMPVRSRAGQVVGAMVVAHTEAERFGSTEESLLADIAAQAGIVLDIARLFRAAEVEISARRRAEEVQRFFAETSAVLSSSLAYPESFEQVGRLCVPFLADLCLIDVAEEHGMRRLTAVHSDPDKARLAAELEERYAPDPHGSHPAASVVRGGPPEVAGSVSDDFLRKTTRDDRHLDIVKELDLTSYMCVPLEARGRRLGALTLVSSGSGRSFGPADLVLAEEFARRAGLALDNARLYSERDHVARALQSSLLPPTLPEIPGAHVTARYRAAGEGNEVGGDFYHVFQVDREAWWFAIGDVSGKGPEAAAIVGLARHTLRALALHERSPRQLLTALHDTLMLGEGRGEFCTVCCALLQPNAGSGGGLQLSLACGGHPPPVIRRADGTVEVATCTGPLLGLPVKLAFVEQTVQLEPGDTVVLYTDGVTEAHHRNQDLFGEERLVDVIRHAGRSVDEVADAIIAAVSDYGPAEPRDDVAVVVLTID